MNWFLFQFYRIGWKWPYIQWRCYRYSRED